MLKLRINGAVYELNVDPETPLLWVLNEQLGLMGTKFSCGIAECGACSVHIDGRVELSCEISVGEVVDKDVTTIEGLKGSVADALFNAWTEGDVPQCGYCQPGQIMTAASLLKRNPNPSDEAINDAMFGVLCRCGTYQGIRQAIHQAARSLLS